MYTSSIQKVQYSRFVYTFCIQMVYKSPPYFCKGLMAIAGIKKTVTSTPRLNIYRDIRIQQQQQL